jgi:hypothetical protein
MSWYLLVSYWLACVEDIALSVPSVLAGNDYIGGCDGDASGGGQRLVLSMSCTRLE